jgi:hypothetical protein
MDMDQQQLASRVLSGSLASTSGSSGSKRNERVWVAVRIRPLLELEQLAHERVAWKPLNTTTLQYVDAERPQQAGTYQYNRVFPDTSSSGEVYQAAARSLVTATMRGYNSTIFAYGQTGSGKTYTMQSMMHAAAEDVFKHIAGAAGREFVVRLSAVEIYNEVVRDLLRDASPALRVQDDPGKGVVAEGLTEAGVQSVEHLRQLLREVEGRRQVRAAAGASLPPWATSSTHMHDWTYTSPWCCDASITWGAVMTHHTMYFLTAEDATVQPSTWGPSCSIYALSSSC